MHLTMTVGDFHHLTAETQSETLEWLERVAPGRYTFDIDVFDEGVCRIMATTAGTNGNLDAGILGACTVAPLHIEMLQWDHQHGCRPCGGCGHHHEWDAVVVGRAIYTSDPPPPALLAAMRAVPT